MHYLFLRPLYLVYKSFTVMIHMLWCLKLQPQHVHITFELADLFGTQVVDKYMAMFDRKHGLFV